MLKVKKMSRKKQETMDASAYTCEFCDRSLKTRSNLGSHKYIRHKELLPSKRVRPQTVTLGNFKCSVCNNVFIFSNALKRHMRTHVARKQKYKCDKCNKQFVRLISMKKHMKQFHENKPLNFQCDLCDKSFHYVSNLEMHVLEAHVEDKEFQCTICLKKFAFEDLFQKHMKRRHLTGTNVQYDCDQCSRTFKQCRSLRYHCLKVHDRFGVCRFCSSSFVSAEEMEAHSKCESENGTTIQIFCTEENCSVELESQCLLTQHCRKIHRNSSTDTEEQSTEIEVKEIFQCSHCPGSFTGKYNLRTHEMAAHPNADWPCKTCNKIFKKKHHLTAHEKCHWTWPVTAESSKTSGMSKASKTSKTPETRQANFSCLICGKTFVTKRRLVVHTRIHDEDKPHKCHLCPKSFVEHRKLQQHLANTHEAVEKPFQCPHCPARFFSRSALHRDHIPSHFDNRPFPCRYCSFAFRTKGSRTMHERLCKTKHCN